MAKGIMYVDGQRVPFDGEPNVLSVIRKAGIEMPTFCYYSDLSVYGACRMCVVEDDRGKIETSCSMKPRDGTVHPHQHRPAAETPADDSGAAAGLPQLLLHHL